MGCKYVQECDGKENIPNFLIIKKENLFLDGNLEQIMDRIGGQEIIYIMEEEKGKKGT